MGAALIVVALLPVHVQAAGNSVTRWVEQALQAVRAQNVGTPNAGRSLRHGDGGDVRCATASSIASTVAHTGAHAGLCRQP